MSLNCHLPEVPIIINKLIGDLIHLQDFPLEEAAAACRQQDLISAFGLVSAVCAVGCLRDQSSWSLFTGAAYLPSPPNLSSNPDLHDSLTYNIKQVFCQQIQQRLAELLQYCITEPTVFGLHI